VILNKMIQGTDPFLQTKY